jgi:hypothetical protein
MSGAAVWRSRRSASRPPGIFLCYRREDTADATGRLYDALVTRFGRGSVFMDIDSIDPGLNFGEVVTGTLASCDVVLAIIGRQWLTVIDAHGRRRLEDPADLVRVELRTALDRDVYVIPVLVQGVVMPGVDQLPEELAALARRNALEMSATHWNYDLERLVAALQKLPLLTAPAVPPSRGETAPAGSPRSRLLRAPRTRAQFFALLGAVAVVVAGVVAGTVFWYGPGAHTGASGSELHAATSRHDPSKSPSPSDEPSVPQKRSDPARTKSIPFTIEYPATWAVQVASASVVTFGLPGQDGDFAAWIEIRDWSAQEAQSQLSSEDEKVTQTSEGHSGLSMTVFDWNNNGDASGLNSNQGHQRLYAFKYHGFAWDIDCGWGTDGAITAVQATEAEQACVAAVNSVKPA